MRHGQHSYPFQHRAPLLSLRTISAGYDDRAMRDLWKRLHAIADATPKRLQTRPPATESAIRAAERTIGIDFPAGYRASLLVHDGQEPGDGDDDAFEWLPGHARLASLERVVAEWHVECRNFAKFYTPGDAPEPIERDALFHFLWHPKRIPIAGNPWWDQDNTLLDFFPGPAGRAGQLVIYGKGTFGALHGPSFGAAFELYVRALESGQWSFRDGFCQPRAKNMNWGKYVRKKLP